MDKEELAKKLKEIDEKYSGEKRVKVLREIRDIIREGDADLKHIYKKTKEELDKDEAK